VQLEVGSDKVLGQIRGCRVQQPKAEVLLPDTNLGLRQDLRETLKIAGSDDVDLREVGRTARGEEPLPRKGRR